MIKANKLISSSFRQFFYRPAPWITLGAGLIYYTLIRTFEGVYFDGWAYPGIMAQSAALVCFLTLLALAWKYSAKSWLPWALLHLFALGIALSIFFLWQSKPAGPGGVIGDSWFNQAMITKARHGLGDHDFAYKNLSPFYPNLYQKMTGTLAKWTSTDAIKAAKYGIYWVAFLLPILAFALWRKLLPAFPALAMVAFCMLSARPHLTYKPFEVISAILFIPWVLHFVCGVRLKNREEGNSWEVAPLQGRQWVWGGLVAGLLFMTYYYYLLLLIVLLPLLLGVGLPKDRGWGVWAFLKPILGMGGVGLLVSVGYWVPLAIDFSRFGMISLQNRWFQQHMVTLPLDVFYQWQGVLGFMSLVVLAVRNELARMAALVLLGVVGFMLVGHLGFYEGFPLLQFRMILLDGYLLNLGLVLGLAVSLAFGKKWLGSPVETWVPVGLSVLIGMNFVIQNGFQIHNEEHRQASEYRPPALAGLPEFNGLSKGKVFLTNRVELAAIKPLFLFICGNAHYNHPSARFRERLKMLVLLQRSQHPDFVAWMLAHNRYDPVDYVLLDQNSLTVMDDDYPNLPNHIVAQIHFQDSVFEGQYFLRNPNLSEVISVKPVPVDAWRGFSVGERRMAAMFSDVEGVRASIPSQELAELDWLRMDRWRNYEAFSNYFGRKWMQEK